MQGRPTFPSGYTQDELGSEIARLFAELHNQYAAIERMSELARAVKLATTERDRLKAMHRLLGLVRSTAQTHPAFPPASHPVACH